MSTGIVKYWTRIDLNHGNIKIENPIVRTDPLIVQNGVIPPIPNCVCGMLYNWNYSAVTYKLTFSEKYRGSRILTAFGDGVWWVGGWFSPVFAIRTDERWSWAPPGVEEWTPLLSVTTTNDLIPRPVVDKFAGSGCTRDIAAFRISPTRHFIFASA